MQLFCLQLEASCLQPVSKPGLAEQRAPLILLFFFGLLWWRRPLLGRRSSTSIVQGIWSECIYLDFVPVVIQVCFGNTLELGKKSDEHAMDVLALLFPLSACSVPITFSVLSWAAPNSRFTSVKQRNPNVFQQRGCPMTCIPPHAPPKRCPLSAPLKGALKGALNARP